MSRVNLEQIARQLHLMLLVNLPPILEDVSQEMIYEDTTYYTQIGESVPATQLVPPAEYSVGHDPLILERAINRFPVITVMAHEQTPIGTGDNYERIANTCYIEPIVVADDFATANRIAWRYAEAVHRALMTFNNLDMNIEPIDKEPIIVISNVITKRRSNVDNTLVYTQGVRLDFSVNQIQSVIDPQSW